MYSLKNYFRPLIPQQEKLIRNDSSVTFVDPDGFTRSGAVFEVREDNPDDKYLGREDWLIHESVSAEYPVMYWVLENGIREKEYLWTVKYENGVYRGQRGFLTAYGIDVHSTDYLALVSLKTIALSNAMDALGTLHSIGVQFNPGTWEITGASEAVANMWEEIVNA